MIIPEMIAIMRLMIAQKSDVEILRLCSLIGTATVQGMSYAVLTALSITIKSSLSFSEIPPKSFGKSYVCESDVKISSGVMALRVEDNSLKAGFLFKESEKLLCMLSERDFANCCDKQEPIVLAIESE